MGSAKSIPTVVTKDCLIFNTTLDAGDLFNGVVVRQANGEITGSRPNAFKIFSFQCAFPLTHLVIDSKRLFGLDPDGTARIYYFNGTTPEIHDLKHKVVNWCVIPRTRIVISWNLLTMRAYNPDKNTNTLLNEHRSRITCGTTSASTFATGDSTGTVCVWYVAGLKCHHKIRTGSEAIAQIIIQASNVYIRNPSTVFCFDGETGTKQYQITITAHAIHHIDEGLLIATPGYLRLFDQGTQILKFKHKTSRFCKSAGSRFWTIQDRNICELELNNHTIQWPSDCIAWIRHPQFPFHKTWPTNRYMDVFAMAVDEWMPEITHWDPPRQWFRHTALRDAIWNWSVVHDVQLATKWMHLSPQTLTAWYMLCVEELKMCCETSYEYSKHTYQLLAHVYTKIRLEDKEILQWCWFHHDKLKMKQIIIHLAERDQDGEFIAIINKSKPSPDAILCMSARAIRLWMVHGYVAVFLRMLQAYHATYPYGPTRETRKTFQLVVSHIFTILDPHDVPLQESGHWKKWPRFMPNDVGKYIRSGFDKGFVTSVIPKEDGTRQVAWDSPVKLDQENAFAWVFYHSEGPHTPLECALNLVNNWHKKESVVQWNWFSSEMGAFLAESKLITVFDKPMRIIDASWDGLARIITSTRMDISEEEHVFIEVESPAWTYMKDNAFNIAPLKLKICSNLSSMTTPPSLQFADDLLKCCLSKTMITEQTWQMEHVITAMASGRAVVGFQNGAIFEYENISSFSQPMRFFNGHVSPVESLHILDDYLVSLSEEAVCVWCLRSGILLFTIDSDINFMAVVPVDFLQIWIIERAEWTVATLWDLDDKMPLTKINLPTDGRTFHAYKILGMPTLVTDFDVVVWTEDDLVSTYQLDVKGTITCVISLPSGVCGATNAGQLFMFDFKNKKIHEWASKNVVQAMATMDNVVITGSNTGEISLWNTRDNDFDLSVHVSDEPVKHIHVQNMFAIVTYHASVRLLSVVWDRSSVSCHAMYQMMRWSPPWKTRLMQSVKEYIQPVVFFCLKNSIATALDLIDMCTEDYADRPLWCAEEFCELLLEMPLDASRNILKRLVSFQGPRIDCVICGDDEKQDTVSFLPACHHRFHTGCIAEHIRKTSEYHDQMQYEYALTVELKCPTCREKFKSEDVKLDQLLNCT